MCQFGPAAQAAGGLVNVRGSSRNMVNACVRVAGPLTPYNLVKKKKNLTSVTLVIMVLSQILCDQIYGG